MKKSNLYTFTGDKGTTSLVGGKRVSKTDARLEAYGTTDELNAHIGVLAEAAGISPDDIALLRFIQNKLFGYRYRLYRAARCQSFESRRCNPDRTPDRRVGQYRSAFAGFCPARRVLCCVTSPCVPDCLPES